MRLLDIANAAQAMRGEDEARLGVSRTIRSGAIQQINQLDICPACRKRTVDGELANGRRLRDGPCEMFKQEGFERILLSVLELEARRHGVTATFDQQSFMHRGS